MAKKRVKESNETLSDDEEYEDNLHRLSEIDAELNPSKTQVGRKMERKKGTTPSPANAASTATNATSSSAAKRKTPTKIAKSNGYT